jgi:ABC-type nickel/cobalt efflux system permease component RcnA
MPHHPGRTTMTTLMRRTALSQPDPRRIGAVAGILAVIGLLALPALVAAHPLGNFTVNHYAGIRVEPGRVLLDVVIDRAEIPTFQARLDFDTDVDGEVSDEEADAGRVTACQALAGSLALAVNGASVTPTLVDAALTFPAGVGGLSTMRLVCGYSAVVADGVGTGALVTFTDRSDPDRVGWHEIVVAGSGVSLAPSDPKASPLRTTSTSHRLTAYPTNLLSQGLHDLTVSMTATPGGGTLPPFSIPDARLVPGATGFEVGQAPVPGSTAPAVGAPASLAPDSVSVSTGVPGGVAAADLPAIFRTTDLSPWVVLVALLTAAALGAAHALTPGHGKTLMAAYLVGTRGTPLHAAGLGLSVTVSHTLGILALATVIVGAEGVFSPDVVVRAAPVVAAIGIVLVGGWMLANEARRRRRRAVHDHEHDHEHRHEHQHEHPHDDGHANGGIDAVAGAHTHRGVTHSHLPRTGSTITWRGLFALGLAGGLIPSTSALLILLGSIAAGRPAFGFVLVVAFGLGMAIVMSGIGLALVLARGRLDRLDGSTTLGRLSGHVPLAAACIVLALGLYLTVQAVGGGTTF